MKAINSIDKHIEKISLDSLKMNSIMLVVLGGPTKELARDHLKRLGYTDNELDNLY